MDHENKEVVVELIHLLGKALLQPTNKTSYTILQAVYMKLHNLLGAMRADYSAANGGEEIR